MSDIVERLRYESAGGFGPKTDIMREAADEIEQLQTVIKDYARGMGGDDVRAHANVELSEENERLRAENAQLRKRLAKESKIGQWKAKL